MTQSVRGRAYSWSSREEPPRDPNAISGLLNLYIWVTRECMKGASKEKIAEIYQNTILVLMQEIDEPLVMEKAKSFYDEAIEKEVWAEYPAYQKVAARALGRSS